MSLHTLAGETHSQIEVKRSRFLAHAGPVRDLEETLAFFERVADPQASHNCWAWKIGNQYRSNDDGEPGGTAGRPILAAIEGRGLDQVMVVVTRWFGGTRLGIGGLVRAYGGCAARCLADAPLVPLRDQAWLRIEAGFEEVGNVHAVLEAFGADKHDERYTGDGVCWEVTLRADRRLALARALADATRGAARVRRLHREPTG